MLAKLTEFDKLIRDLDDQIAVEKQALVRQIEESNARVTALMVRRERLKEAVQTVTTAVATEASPAQDDRAVRTGVPGRAAAIMVEALRESDPKGLAGGAIKTKVLAAGLSVAAADKAKTRLKKAGIVKLEDGQWRLTDKGKKDAAAMAR